MKVAEVASWHIGHAEIPSMLGYVAVLRIKACMAAVASGPRFSIRSHMLGQQLVLMAISVTKVALGEHLAIVIDLSPVFFYDRIFQCLLTSIIFPFQHFFSIIANPQLVLQEVAFSDQ